MARLNANGTLDTGFNPGTGANNAIKKIALQPDGKFLIVGDFTTYNGISRNGIARINADGQLDVSFNPGTGPNAVIRTVALQTDGKIIIGGDFTSYNGTARNRLARLNSDGTVDTSFNPGAGADGPSGSKGVTSAAIQPDGKIVITGGFNSYYGVARNRIARVNSDGSIDTSFDPGSGANNETHMVYVLASGKLLVSGWFTAYNGSTTYGLVRVNADGSRDGTFNIGSSGPVHSLSADVQEITGIAEQSDGKIVLVGVFSRINTVTRKYFARIEANGLLDLGFYGGTGANAQVYAIALQPDGKILIGGFFTLYNGVSRNMVARLNPDGSLDSTFDPGTGPNFSVYTLAVQADGKIIIGGNFTAVNALSRNYIARLQANGTLDPSFNPGSGFNGYVESIAIQTDGKIIVSGGFTSFNGTTRNRIARLNPNGTFDTSFTMGTGASNRVRSVRILPDGKIIIGGDFISYNGTTRYRVARLLSNGSLDTSFGTTTGLSGSVHSVAVQSDGRVVVGGYFTTFNSTNVNNLARLTNTGALDPTFIIGSGANDVVRSVEVQPDGKILMAGMFTTYNGASSNGIARVNANGTYDASFDVGTGLNLFSGLPDLAIQPDGKVLVAGEFTSYKGIGRNRITRIIGDTPAEITTGTITPDVMCMGVSVSVPFSVTGSVFPGNVFTAQLSNASGSFASPATIGTLTGNNSGTISVTIPLSLLAGTGYRIRVVATDLHNTTDNGSDITLNAIPVVAITATPASLCLGSSTTLSATGATTYSWTAGVGLSGISDAVVTATPTATGNTTYSVTGTSNGCTATAGIVVNTNPLPNVMASAMNNSICAGQSATIFASGANTYSWSSGATGSTLVIVPAGTTTYTVFGTTQGCTQTAITTITVTPYPVVSIVSSSPAVCLGQTVTLTASGAASYTWSSGHVGNILSVSPTASSTYSVTGYNSPTCAATANTSVSVITPPVAAAANFTVCEGNQVTLVAVSAIGANYTWTGPNNFVSSLQNPVITNLTSAQAGTYTLNSNLNGCNNQSATAVAILPLPVAAFTVQNSGCCEVIISNASTGAVNYSFNFGDGSPNSIQPNPTHVYANPGTYTITLTATSSDGCIAVSSQTVSIINSAPEQVFSQIKIYPNPTSGSFSINLSDIGVGEPVHVELVNTLGQVLLSRKFESGSIEEITLTNFAEGAYLVRLYLGNQLFNQKILLRR